MRPTLYLANAYGFSKLGKETLGRLVTALTEIGYEVWEPFARNDQVDMSDPEAAMKIGRKDFMDVQAADVFFAVVNGCPPDEGVMVELGIAIALAKPIFLFRDDFRRCSDSDRYPLNLMVFTGHGRDWKDFYYASLWELSDPQRPLAKYIS